MLVTYKYPVVHFFGDDLEDSEKVEKEGQIRLIRTGSEPYSLWGLTPMLPLMWRHSHLNLLVALILHNS